MIQGLCIGGPWDRKLYASPNNGFDVWEQGPIPFSDFDSAMQVDAHPVRRSTYYRHELCQDRVVWRHETLTVEDMTDRLLKAYKGRRK